MKSITVDGRRYNLAGMVRLECSHVERNGVSLQGAWYGPRSQRLIVEKYSIWENRSQPGACVGTFYEVHEPGADTYDLAVEYCEKHGATFPEDVPVTTISE